MIQKVSKPKHSNFYKSYIISPEWRVKSKACIMKTKNRCVLLPFMLARHTHHLTYKNLGKEMFIRDIVPLSKVAHKLVHFDIFWKTPLRPLVNLYLRFICLIVWFYSLVF